MTSPPPAPARAHPWHDFDGMRIVSAADGTRLIAALCACGAVLDIADAVFVACDEHAVPACARCGGAGEVVDHRALAWRAPTSSELELF